MNKFKQRLPLFYGIALVIAGLPLLFGSGTFASILLVAVIAAFYVSGGHIYYLYGSAVALIMAFLASGAEIIEILIFAAGTLSTALIIGKGFKKEISFSYLLILSTLMQTLSALLSLSYIAWKNNVDIDYFLITQPIEEVREAAQNAAGAELLQVLETIESTSRIIIPSILLVSCAVSAYAAFAITRFILRKLGDKDGKFPRFYELRLNRTTAVIFLVLFAVSIILGGVSPEVINIIIVCLFVFAACGISVADYFLKKRRVFGFLRFLIYIIALPILAFVIPILNPLMIFAGIGIADSFKNLRRLGWEGAESEKQ